MADHPGTATGSSSTSSPGGADPFPEVCEEEGPGPVPHVLDPGWRDAFPWLVHGVTLRGRDLGLRGSAPSGEVSARWEEVLRATGMVRVVFAPQVHGSTVRTHASGPPGLAMAGSCDGHATRDPGILLAVTVADCVPVFLLAPEVRAVGLLHAGWRGVAAGILEEGIRTFGDRFGADPSALHAWLGPSISPAEYEVGPEVHEALDLPDPGRPALLDLRDLAARRLCGAGVPAERIGVSSCCTRRDPRFYSHRGGEEGRQAAFLGIVERSEEAGG